MYIVTLNRAVKGYPDPLASWDQQELMDHQGRWYCVDNSCIVLIFIININKGANGTAGARGRPVSLYMYMYIYGYSHVIAQ